MINKQRLLDICFDKVIPAWDSMSDSFPDFLHVYTPKEQPENAAAKDIILPHLKKAIPAIWGEDPNGFLDDFRPLIADFLGKEHILYIKDHISQELWDDFEKNLIVFLTSVREFDRRITAASVWQALRNYLIYSVIVAMQAEPLNCKDSAFGFSLLYPYTDNYIDTCKKTGKSKSGFNDFIRAVILGEKAVPVGHCMKKTKQLLEMAINQYDDDPDKRSQAAALLLYMLEAQENSMRQLDRSDLTRREILEISAQKGGFSVLIDYLFAIDLDTDGLPDSELEFYLSFGLMLQLMDDIEDISEDKTVSRTLMTSCASTEELEKTVNRLFHFIHSRMTGYTAKSLEMQGFIARNSELAVIFMIMKSHNAFSEEYMEKMRPHMPFLT